MSSEFSRMLLDGMGTKDVMLVKRLLLIHVV